MASLSFDARGFSLDGQRLWLVATTLHYARTPPPLWPELLDAAQQAGFNTIEVPIPWALHEPEPGRFDFADRADLRRFIQLLAQRGLHAILRPGPYIGDGYDMGGLPPWLLTPHALHTSDPATPSNGSAPRPTDALPPIRLRQASPAFLQPVARYFDALIARLADLQHSRSPAGPILAVQVEHLWLCSHDKQAQDYLLQLSRFLREAGCTVPLLSRNNLWQPLPGVIETWHGDDQALASARQLATIQPDAPCLMHVGVAADHDTWGRPASAARPADVLLRQLAEVAAAGAMFNLAPLAASMALPSTAGRLTGSDDRFLTSVIDPHAPVALTGRRTRSYDLIKRLATFCSHFQSVFTHLRPDHHAVAASPLSVIHQHGSAGSVVFILRDPAAPPHTELITPDGQTLPIALGDDTAAWTLLRTPLGPGLPTLDLTNLRPWALAGRKLLILFGPPGSDALVSLDRVLLHAAVPKRGEPPVVLHQRDGLHVVILNTPQLDAAYLHPAGLHVGVRGIDPAGSPQPHPEFATGFDIDLDGRIRRHTRVQSPAPRPPRLSPWARIHDDRYADGSAPRFATLPGPRSLEACGSPTGYGWYRLRLPSRRPRDIKLLIPHAGDRLHLYHAGKLRAVVGVGPGATTGPLPLKLPAGPCELVFLADNLGRFSEDLLLDEPKGLYGHLLDVRPLPLPKPKMAMGPRFDPFQLTGFVPRCSTEDLAPQPRYTFNIPLTKRTPLVLQLRGDRPRSAILVNNRPVALDPGGGLTQSHFLYDPLRKGTNRITLALIDPPGTRDTPGDPKFDPRRIATLYRVVENLSEQADWWYARWTAPTQNGDAPTHGDATSTHGDAASKNGKLRSRSAPPTPLGPAFFRATFTARHTPAPLMLHLAGATKGQLYLNGHDLGRYFIATHEGRPVPPLSRYPLPACWIREGENELLLFDEHGKTPTKSRLIYEGS